MILLHSYLYVHRLRSVFASCFSGASDVEILLVFTGLHMGMDGITQLAGTVSFRTCDVDYWAVS